MSTKIKKGGLDQYMALNALVDSFCHNQKMCGTEMVLIHAA